MEMTHGSLFSGIGGFDLASEWIGWENKFHCEWNQFGQKVLHYYWPDAELFTDITKSNFTKYANKIDVLTGGFPCQPYSSAGKRLGKEDDRHLWPEMLRAIREIQPRYVVGENVRGLTNWNGGLVFDEVQSDLEIEGYEVTPFLLPACAVNAPHRRDRIWFIAYNNGIIRGKGGNVKSGKQPRYRESILPIKSERTTSNTNSNGFNKCNSQHEINASEGRINAFGDTYKSNDNGNATNTTTKGLEQTGKPKGLHKKKRNLAKKRNKSSVNTSEIYSKQITSNTNSRNSETRTQRQVLEQSHRQETNGHSNVERRNQWENFPTVSPICIGDDGLSNRLDGITFPKWRNESIKAAGNAIVPQVAYQIFKAIQEIEKINKNL